MYVVAQFKLYLLNMLVFATCWNYLDIMDYFSDAPEEAWNKTWAAIEAVMCEAEPDSPSMHRWTACGLFSFLTFLLTCVGWASDLTSAN